MQLPPPKLTSRLRRLLEALLKNGGTPQSIATRGRIILDLHDLHGKVSAVRISELTRQSETTVHRWRKRWGERVDELIAADEAGVDDKELLDKLRTALRDAPRSGAPPYVQRRTERADRGARL